MLIEKSDAALRRSRLLLHASEALSATATTADVLVTVPALLRDALGAAHAAVVQPGGEGVAEALARTAVGERRSQFYESAIDLSVEHPTLAEAFTALGWQAAVCAPLPSPASGALLLAWDEPRRFFVFDRAVVATLAVYVSQALERAVKHDAKAAVTEALQEAMLSQLPRVDDFDLAAYYRPADAQRVGGDWYDVIPGPGDRLALVIGDVVGHDPAAAARMGRLRNMLRAYLVDRREHPSTLLRRLDAANHALGEPTMATAVVAFIDRALSGVHRLRWSNAGHPPPILLDPTGAVRPLTGNDLLLGARRAAPRHTYTAALPPGSTVLLHTDGLIESRAHSIDVGFTRLLRRLRSHDGGSPRDLLNHVARDLATDCPDDIAMLAVHIPFKKP